MQVHHLLFLLSLTLFTASCVQKKDGAKLVEPSGAAAFRVGLVFDVGGRGDKSFNDAAFAGLERAVKDFSLKLEYIEPGAGADRKTALEQLAAQPDVKLIVGAGFIFTDDITDVALAFPDKKFACVDYTLDSTRKIPDNLLPILFKEEEGSFLVGAIAALTSKTGVIGFVGGMDSPLIKKFERGYINGAKYVRPDIKVEVGYAGLSGEGFNNPVKGKELALIQYGRNADVIYHASGKTGDGVFDAAREKQKFAIGVDMNQEDAAPGLVLTSMVKLVDNAVYEVARQVKDGTFQGGKPLILGLASKGVDYVYNEKNKSLIPDDVRAKVEDLRAKIISGEIQPLGTSSQTNP
jgi:basic membrane protein A